MSLQDILNFLSTQRASIKQNGDRMSAQQISNVYHNVLTKANSVYRDELGKRINKGEYDYLEKAFPKHIGEGKKLGYRLKSRVNFLNASLKSKSKDIRARASVQKKKDGWIDAALAQINDNVYYLYKESKNADRDIPTDLTALNAHTLSNILKKAIKNTKVVIRTSQQRLDISKSVGSGEDSDDSTTSNSSEASITQSSSSATYQSSSKSSTPSSSSTPRETEQSKQPETTKVIWPSSNSNERAQSSSKAPEQRNSHPDRLHRPYSSGRKPSMLDHVKHAFSGKIKHFFNTYDTQKAQHQNIQKQQSHKSSSITTQSEDNSNPSSESITHVQHNVQSTPNSALSSNSQVSSSESSSSQSNDVNSDIFASLSASASHSASASVSAVASRTSASLSRANSVSNSIKASASISDILSRSSASASAHYSMMASVSRSNSLSSISASLSANKQNIRHAPSNTSVKANGAQQVAMQSKSSVNNFSQNSVSSNEFKGEVADDDSKIRNSALNFFNKLSAYHHRIQTSYADRINEAQSVTNSYSSALIAQSFATSMDLSKATSSADLAVISAQASVKSSMTASTAQQLGIKDASVAAMRSSMMKSFNTTTDAIEANNVKRTSVEKSSAIASTKAMMQKQNRTSMAVAGYRTSQANSKATYYSNRAEFYSNALSMLDSYYGAKASQMARHAQEIGLTRNLANQKISNYHGKSFPKFHKMDDLKNYLNGVTPTPSQIPNNSSQSFSNFNSGNHSSNY